MMARDLQPGIVGWGPGAGEGKYPTDQSPPPGPDHRGLNLQTSCHRVAELDRWGAEPDERVAQFGGFAFGVYL